MKKSILIFIGSILMLSMFTPAEYNQLSQQQADQLNARIRLCEELDAMIRTKEYQPRSGKFFCNIGARDILDDRFVLPGWIGSYYGHYSLDLRSIFPRPIDILAVNIDLAYQRALYAIKRGWIIQHTPESATARAWQGVPIWVIVDSKLFSYGHEAILYPEEIYQPSRGVRIAQCGAFPGIAFARDQRVFGQLYKSKRILYIEFKEKS